MKWWSCNSVEREEEKREGNSYPINKYIKPTSETAGEITRIARDLEMLPAFQFKIGHQISQKFVTFGTFEDGRPSLAMGTTGGKILLHSPHDSGEENGEMPHVRFLNFNKKITSLCSGNLGEEKNIIPRDYLLVGTQSTLSAYDVQRNSDVFFRDVSDGVNTLIVGTLGSLPPYVFAGGNCSVLGFKSTGAEAFWTVSGDNVSALALSDINGDGLNELIVGSDDYEIRFFQNEEMIAEQTEADKIEFLSPIDRTLFSYGLANGSVGVYTGPKNRLWRVKTKHKVTSLISYDLNCDGVPEVISGWSNGLLNIRNIDNGETLYKQVMPSPIASLVKGDYRLDGKEELIVCSVHGTISGYLPIDFETIPLSTNANTENGSSNGPVSGGQLSNDQKMLDEMQAKKLDLSNELRQIEKTIKTLKSGESLPPGSLPPETQLSYSFVADPLRKGILLTVEASTDVQVSSIIVIDLESVILSGSEILTVTPSLPTRQISVLIRPTRNAPASLRVQTHIAVRGFNTNLFVFEEVLNVPRFASFAQLSETSPITAPASHVTFRINEDMTRFISWMQASFILFTAPKVLQDKLRMNFVSVCGTILSTSNSSGNPSLPVEGIPLFIFVSKEDSAINVQVRCDNMELAADIVQDIAKFFKITELESVVNFPQEMEAFEEVLKRVAEYNTLRVRMSADMADDSQRVKALIVRAEDARLMTDMETMGRAYTDLYSLNNQLIAGYNNRANTHQSLLNALKDVNQMIQRAANLRVGTAKTRVINDCRVAVKANNMQSLFRIIRQGFDTPPQTKK